MRYPSLFFAVTLALAPTMVGCGDDGGGGSNQDGGDDASTDGESGSPGETSAGGGSEAADGMGDGDGDPGDGDSGDGDGDSGDGDGEPGDGDGEPGDGDGDGDGDLACVPANDSPCAACTADNCCAEQQACDADETCSCFASCVEMGENALTCATMCNIDNPMQVPAFGELRLCMNEACMAECGDGGGGGGNP